MSSTATQLMLTRLHYKMTHKKILITVISFLSLFSTVKLSSDVDIVSHVKYREGQWTGHVACTFNHPSNCLLSMHVDGRRIDVDTAKKNEIVFVSCYSSSTSIDLKINHFTYHDVQDYSCLQDDTQLYNHTWLTPNPYIEVQQLVGAVVNLTCNHVSGAELYWILPGDSRDNNEVKIIDSSNAINASTSAIVKLEDPRHTSAEYKCCARLKDGQFHIPCTSHIFTLDDVQLADAITDFSIGNTMVMTCILQSKSSLPDQYSIQWLQCNSNSACSTIYSTGFTTKVDSDAKTLNTTYKTTYSNSGYTSFQCAYKGKTLHTFEVQMGSKSPTITKTTKRAYYSSSGYEVKLSCSISSNPEPSIVWTQSKLLEFSNGSQTITSGGDYDIDVVQLSGTEWQTTLVIYPYDVSVHNNIYTCSASNSLGQSSAQLNTNEDSANIDVKLISKVDSNNSTSSVQASCTFTTFPFPPNYRINVITDEDVQFNTVADYDDREAKATITVNFDVHHFPVILECSAFNPFNSTSQINNQLYID